MLHYNTVTFSLRNVLEALMEAKEFDAFRLVGGTALSLYYGHRMSIDIDLFTDADYGTIDFEIIDDYLRQNYKYVDTHDYNAIGIGKSYYVGNDEHTCIKLDLYYTDSFIHEPVIIDRIRLASIEEIIAMKLDVIQRTGRKKDFWDLHELKKSYTVKEMFALHKQRYPYTHNQKILTAKFTDFSEADDDFEPDCLRGKHWELIKLDLIELIEDYSKNFPFS